MCYLLLKTAKLMLTYMAVLSSQCSIHLFFIPIETLCRRPEEKPLDNTNREIMLSLLVQITTPKKKKKKEIDEEKKEIRSSIVTIVILEKKNRSTFALQT